MSQLAANDPEVREFEAEVTSIEGRELRLDRSYFYAESGGQPADRGTISDLPLANVTERDGDVVHVLDADPEEVADAVEVGETVACAIDDEFRTYCTRAHTASHLLYGAGRRLLDDLGYGGFDIDTEKVRVDLTTSTDVDDETLVELERLVNRTVWESRPVTWEEIPVEEATDRPEVAFNAKTEEGAMADADAIRVVTVGGLGRTTEPADADTDSLDGGEADGDAGAWDVAACGGTHVSNTAEIGPVTLLDRSNPGEGLTRVEFAVGPAGVDRRATVHAAARTAAAELGVATEDLGEAAERVRAERDDLESTVAELRADLASARLRDLPTVERDGRTWRIGAVEEFGPNDVSDPVRALVDGDAEESGHADADGGPEAEVEAAAVVGSQGATFVVVATDGDPEAGAVVEAVTDEFGGGGGGGPTFAQGGGIDARPETVAARLREE